MNANARLRGLATVLAAAPAIALFAQDSPAPMGTAAFEVGRPLIYALVALAVVQVVFIASLAGIMRTLGGPGGWVRKLVEKRTTGRAAALLPLALLAGTASAQAYTGGDKGLSNYELFWFLIGVNVLLFIILFVQLRLVRSLTAMVTGAVEGPVAAAAVQAKPSWAQGLMKKMTRQVALDQEKDIELHHDYDGIKELDNVLPPWWLWLFYATIIWGVVYLVNVHVIKVWPDSVGEYNAEMVQAQADIDAYLATLTHTVDEHTVTFTDDAGVLATGRELFTTFCTACHGPDGAGAETSVGPNLTDPYWIHGGGINNIFRTIKYGVPEKGMIAWQAQLQPAEISALASYIMTLEGKGSATGKGPEGDLWQEDAQGAPGVDSTAVVPDTVRVAMARQ
ncbi:MAG: cbb3-type cytochrome c oxidase N-terminal domain-containing protein [Flavobacteriales bacterium]|jgi:cytochrome c oxidase cbb3-type subunit 3|nr:cbb3-type cytochrome c oxidase N-terminal domain-containing protein [Flavobacteriales bacterium]